MQLNQSLFPLLWFKSESPHIYDTEWRIIIESGGNIKLAGTKCMRMKLKFTAVLKNWDGGLKIGV